MEAVQSVPRSVFEEVLAGAEEKTKTYRAVVWFQEAALEDGPQEGSKEGSRDGGEASVGFSEWTQADLDAALGAVKDLQIDQVGPAKVDSCDFF